MPMPVMTYKTMKIVTSAQLSPHPQATGAAAMTAANGMITKAQSAMRMPVGCFPSVSGFGPGAVAAVGFSRTGADMAPRRWSGTGSLSYAYVTVTYGTVRSQRYVICQ